MKANVVIWLTNMNGNGDKVYKQKDVYFYPSKSNYGLQYFIFQNELADLGFVKNDSILVNAIVDIL